MKPCSNPLCTNQVEDDARFCGMCGAYVGPEMTSDTALDDASIHRIQQCRDLISSLQSEPDEKEKAQKLRTVVNILISINTNHLSRKPEALVTEQIQVLSTVVQEMITLPSISQTASAADMQHWPISPLEMQQWTELLVALTGSNKFSSFDEATKNAVRVALRRFISFVGINARSNPDAERVLLNLYENITVLSVPELQNCFLGVNKGMLLRRVEQRIQHSLSNTSPRITPAEVQMFGDLASEELTLSKVGPTLEGRTRETIKVLEKIQRLGETDVPLNEAIVEAYTTLLSQSTSDNKYLQHPKAELRMDVAANLVQAALVMARLSDLSAKETADSLLAAFAVLSQSLSAMVPSNYPQRLSFAAVNAYADLMHEIAVNNTIKKEAFIASASSFLSAVGNTLFSQDRALYGKSSQSFAELRK